MKKWSSQVEVMKPFSTDWDSSEFLKIIDKMKYKKMILISDRGAILNDNQTEMHKKSSNES